MFTPSLTGIGERVHLASPQVNLTTHVTDVVNTILYEDLSDIVLLGYSYGGMVVTGSLEYVADRVAHLVYLDAFLPADGQSLNDLRGRRLRHERHRAGRRMAGAADVPAARRRGGGRLAPRAAPRTRSAASPSRSGCASRSRSTPSPARMSRPPQVPAQHGRRPARAVLAGRRPHEDRPRMALPGDRHRPHDPGQAPGGAHGTAARAHLAGDCVRRLADRSGLAAGTHRDRTVGDGAHGSTGPLARARTILALRNVGP